MPGLDLSKVKKEYLTLGVIVLITVVVLFAYRSIFRPLMNRIKDVSAQIEQKERNILKAKIGPQALKKLEDQANEIKSQIDYYQQKLTVKAEVPQILKELNKIAEGLKIKIISINPLKTEETPLPGEKELLMQIPIKISLRCGYHQLGIFINQLENSSSFMKITELKISADSRDIWTHQVDLVITSYRLTFK